MNRIKMVLLPIGLLRMVELRESREQMVGDLSGGSKETLVLVGNYFESSKVDFLDEPTTGMDSKAVDNFWKLLSSKSLHLLW